MTSPSDEALCKELDAVEMEMASDSFNRPIGHWVNTVSAAKDRLAELAAEVASGETQLRNLVARLNGLEKQFHDNGDHFYRFSLDAGKTWQVRSIEERLALVLKVCNDERDLEAELAQARAAREGMVCVPRAMLTAVGCTEFSGYTLNDVGGKNWFDLRDEILSAAEKQS